MKRSAKLLAEMADALLKPREVEVRYYGDERDEDMLDKMTSAFDAEYDRWVCRRKSNKGGFELVRNSSPKNNIVAEEYQEITNLTKRECRDYCDAEAWRNTYAGRAAMRKALEALR